MNVPLRSTPAEFLWGSSPAPQLFPEFRSHEIAVEVLLGPCVCSKPSLGQCFQLSCVVGSILFLLVFDIKTLVSSWSLLKMALDLMSCVESAKLGSPRGYSFLCHSAGERLL